MEVHILLEHQLDDKGMVESTTITNVFLNREDAENELEYAQEVDKRYVKRMMCDPCKYTIKTFKVIK